MKIKKYLNVFFITTKIILFIACGTELDDGEDNEDSDSTNFPSSSGTSGSTEIDPLDIGYGSWVSPCTDIIADDNVTVDYSHIYNYSIVEEAFQKITMKYLPNSNCSEESLVKTVTVHYTFNLQATENETYFLTLYGNQESAILETEDEVTEANNSSLYGYTDWTIGTYKSKDISSEEVYTISRFSDDQLCLGTSNDPIVDDGSTDSTRHTVIDEDSCLEKNFAWESSESATLNLNSVLFAN